MKKFILISIVCALLFVGRGNSEDEVAPLYEKGFVATFGKFRTMPQTRGAAENAGWEFDGNSDDPDCTNGGKFNGFRYTEPGNTAIGLLFAENGQVAGFQSLFPLDVFENSVYRFEEISMIQLTNVHGIHYRQITIYLVDPGTICDKDAPQRDLTKNIDVDVYYQNGPSPEHLVPLPKHRPQAEEAGWDSMQCFPQMGWHSLYHSEEFNKTECTKFEPTLALYDTETGTLIGCGVWIYARSEITSDRFEKPPPEVVKIIVEDKLDPCIFEDVTTSLHMYFISDPESITCDK